MDHTAAKVTFANINGSCSALPGLKGFAEVMTEGTGNHQTRQLWPPQLATTAVHKLDNTEYLHEACFGTQLSCVSVVGVTHG